jgi:hypothetical protein
LTLAVTTTGADALTISARIADEEAVIRLEIAQWALDEIDWNLEILANEVITLEVYIDMETAGTIRHVNLTG